ncbi:MAG: PKD domain-containing protein [Gemmatimonas sp.]
MRKALMIPARAWATMGSANRSPNTTPATKMESMRKSLLSASLVLALAACYDAPTATSVPLFDMSSGQQAHPRYIVRFRDSEMNAASEADRLVRAHGGRLAFRYNAAIKGFAGEFSAASLAALAREGIVVSIEEDQIAYATGTQPNPPSWGLDRVDQRALPLNTSYGYGATGAGVTVYIIDTGILFSHTDFGGRAVTGVDQITPGGTALDCDGHGTHVAGTVGGNTYGVAKSVSLVAVRVLDCTGSGSYSQVIAGVDWVTQRKLLNPATPMVANMSLGGPFSAALDAAVANSVAAGVTYAVAAGNSSANACLESPSSTATAITVASTTIGDARSSFSNFGSCVDIFAPGSSITSTWISSNTATSTLSGTSMASPHVAGAAALFLEANPSALPAAVATALSTNATMNVVTSPGAGTTNRLLYTGFITAGPPPVPVANYTFSCTNLSCSFDAASSTAQPNATYAWAWGDGTANGAGKTATHVFGAGGTYNVILTVNDGGGTNSLTRAVTVTAAPANQAPVAVVLVSCSGLTCTFDGRGSTDDAGIVAYEWRDGEVTPVSTQAIWTKTLKVSGTRTWTLTVRDAGGLSNVKSFTFTAPTPAPPPVPVANYTFSCTNLNCSFDAASSTAQANATYAWAWGDGTANGAGKTATHVFGTGGTYTVILTVNDAGGTHSRTQAVTVTAPPPVPVANYAFTCTNLSCSFDAASSTAQPNATYAWAWGDGTANGAGKTATHVFGAGGTYNVILTVNDAGGSNSRTRAVTVTAAPANQAPVAVVLVSCNGLTCTFDGRGSTDDAGIVAYEWRDGEPTPVSTQAIWTKTLKLSGTRTWTLTVRDAGGLSSTKSFTFTAP